MTTTIKGDLNHVTAEGHFIGNVRRADGSVEAGLLLTVKDSLSDETRQGKVLTVLDDGRVIIDIELSVPLRVYGASINGGAGAWSIVRVDKSSLAHNKHSIESSEGGVPHGIAVLVGGIAA